MTGAPVEALPFDQYQRYRLVADLVNAVRGERGQLRILDVGGRTGLLRQFLPSDDVQLVDMEASDVSGLVLGDGSRLPFQAGAFDIVAAFDTLEHVPPPRREAFVAECARVTRGHVFIAGPYQAPRVDEAEEILTDFLREKLKTRHRYLAEHREYGLPDRAVAESVLRGQGLSAGSVGHANLDRWLVLMCLEFYLDFDPMLRPVAERIFRFYNESLYASDHLEPVYRHVVMGARDGLSLPSADQVLDAPGAPSDTMTAVLPLAREMLAFDHQRTLIEPELERLHEVVRSLEEDLRQHDSTLATVRQDLEGHSGTITELSAALAREREAAEALENELKRERTQAEAVRAELTQDLEGNRATVATLRAELESARSTEAELRGEIEARGAAIDHLRPRVSELEAAVDDLEAELTARLQEVRSGEEQIAHLVALLRDRKANLKRAFARGKFGD